jgi:hypothetical protein
MKMGKWLLACVLAFQGVIPTLGYQHLSNEQGTVLASFASVIGTTPLVTVAIPIALDPTAPVAPDVATTTATQSLSTPVYDAISDSYTTVTTTKATGESEIDFIRRHNQAVHTLTAENKADAKREGIDWAKAKQAHDGAFTH